MTENRVEAIAALVGAHTETYQGNQFTGNNKALASLLGVHPSRVTRWVDAGSIPVQHNRALMAWADGRGVLAEMKPQLEQICPCCGNSAVAM